MRQISSRCTLIFAALILLFALAAFLVNLFFFHFKGNNYFPENIAVFSLLLILTNLGLRLSLPLDSKIRIIGKEFFYFFLTMCVIALATNAIQLTPFKPIDSYIIAWEHFFHINMDEILTWTHHHPFLAYSLHLIYDSLPYQMSFLPIFVILSGQVKALKVYYFFLLSSTFFGFSFYYFFPTTAPASVISSPFFSASQIATGLKFQQIHQHLLPSTNAGGLIALPSFHAIWAVLCVSLLRPWPIFCITLGLFNSILIISCVLLGWHYFSDIIGSVIILLLSYFFYKKCQKRNPH